VGRSEEQAALNESAFREANERIAERRAELTAVAGPTPFLCECEDPRCTEIVRLTLAEYEQVRAESTQFMVVPGHPTNGEATSVAGDGWVCVRKQGADAEIVRETDPRRP
jgi:hypothetical protein